MAPPEFILKGKTKNYPLHLSHVSVAMMERETGVKFTALFDHVTQAAEAHSIKKKKDRDARLRQLSMEIGLGEILALLFAGLEGYRRKFTTRIDPITLDEAGDVMTDCGGMPGVQYVIADALQAYLPSVTGLALEDRVNGKKKKAAHKKRSQTGRRT